jgi:CAAX protease family protein
MVESDRKKGGPIAHAAVALPFVLPLVVYLSIGALEPSADKVQTNAVVSTPTTSSARYDAEPGERSSPLAQRFVALTVVKFVVVGACLIYFFPAYRRCFPMAVDGWAWGVGILGVVLWVGICALQLEPRLLAALGFNRVDWGQRSQFNPFLQIDSSTWQAVFLAARFGLLVLVVPLAEEMFVRGFLMRAVQSGQWTQVSLRNLGWPALASGSIYAVLTHPSEAVAAVGWFSLVSWLMVRTDKIWNCVLAHAVTNGLLGLYVIYFNQWQYW